jgi:thiamine-phosphate pyrophosphorylase
MGIERLRKVCCQTAVPVFALGGIKQELIVEVMEAEAAGVALISAILRASDVKAAARAFIHALGK